MSAQTAVACSDDGVPIHYDVNGTGSPALVFVHGWVCDRHYWDGQAAPFAPRHTIVRLDLAGHGASGRNRVRWTVPAFGQDVAAVIKNLGLKKVVLNGPSMAGGAAV